jgi:hypothetical protein
VGEMYFEEKASKRGQVPSLGWISAHQKQRQALYLHLRHEFQLSFAGKIPGHFLVFVFTCT